MRPFGTSKQLARRRQRALQLLRNGQAPAAVAKQVGATAQSVRRGRRAQRQPKRTVRRRVPGRPSYLCESQRQHLVCALKRGAYANGYAEDYWTLERIAHVIWDLFGVRYHPSSVWHLLRRLGWSCQRPQRRTFARDEEAIAPWKHYTWPQIKKVACVAGQLAVCR